MNDKEKEAVKLMLPYDIPTYENWTSIAKFYHPLMAGSIDGTDLVPHDKAIVRASKSRYKPNKKVVGDPKKTLMVRHLNPSTTEKTLSHTFSKYGDLEKCRLIRDIISGNSKRYAFVEYKNESDARKTVRHCQDLLLDGNKVIVDFECERTLPGWIPRRFGGGFGGKKESGQLRFGGIERPFRRPIPLNSKSLGKRDYNALSEEWKRSDHRERSWNKRSRR